MAAVDRQSLSPLLTALGFPHMTAFVYLTLPTERQQAREFFCDVKTGFAPEVNHGKCIE